MKIFVSLLLIVLVGSFAWAKQQCDLVRFTDSQTDLMGYKDGTGKIMIPAQFSMVDRCFNAQGLSDVWVGKKWYKINKRGTFIVQSYLFDNGADYYVAGLARYIKAKNGHEKVGFIDGYGNIRILATFDWASPFENPGPSAIVCQGCKRVPADVHGEYHKMVGGRWGAINKAGAVIVPLKYANREEVIARIAAVH